MKEIIISIEQSLAKKLESMIEEGELLKDKTFTYALHIFPDLKPVFATKEQLEYFKSIGIDMPDSNVYRIYIGKNITEPRERINGAELPAIVLDNRDLFRKEIVSRIKREVGSPEDN